MAAARPDVIPDRCGDCVHFMLIPVLGKHRTGCGFYGEETSASSSCIASRMEREDEEIEERLRVGQEAVAKRRLMGPPGLRRYLLEARGTSRTQLNVMLAIGVVTFGILMPVAFSKLGRAGTGWVYFVVVALLAFLGLVAAAVFFIPAVIVYGVGWIHADAILSRIRRAGHDRLEELDRGIPGREDTAAERAVIMQKVFGDTGDATIPDSQGDTQT